MLGHGGVGLRLHMRTCISRANTCQRGNISVSGCSAIAFLPRNPSLLVRLRDGSAMLLVTRGIIHGVSSRLSGRSRLRRVRKVILSGLKRWRWRTAKIKGWLRSGGRTRENGVR